MDEVKRSVESLIRRAQRSKSSDSDSSVNVARRSNIVVARNIGSEGSTRTASAKQSVRIRQRDGETIEVSETVENTSDSSDDRS